MQITHQASIVGNIFIRDSSKVIDVLKELTLGNQSKTLIKGIKCGRKSTQEIKAHYDGTSEGARRKKLSSDNLNKILYKNETTFTSQKYVTKLKEMFNVLGKYGVPLYEEKIV